MATLGHGAMPSQEARTYSVDEGFTAIATSAFHFIRSEHGGK